VNTGAGQEAFLTAFKGSFVGILRWAQFEALWARLAEDAASGWYVYALSEPPPQAPLGPVGFRDFLSGLSKRLRQAMRDDRCGFVYVDDFEQPGFVKIYRPERMGCGIATSPIMPGWVLSKITPAVLAVPSPRSRFTRFMRR
jgi:hypothetical protein